MIPIPEKLIPLFDKLQDLIQKQDSVLIGTHVNPDGDCIGSALALRSYLVSIGKKVLMINENEMPNYLKFLSASEDFRVYDSFNEKFPNFNLAIILDSGSLSRIGKVQSLIKDQTIVNIDHHSGNDTFGHLNIIDTQASSIGEILFLFFTHINFDFKIDSAEALYVSIVTDTGHFKYEKTRPIVHLIAAQLLEKGVRPEKMNRLVYQTKPFHYLQIMEIVLSHLTLFHHEKIAYSWLSYEDLEKFNHASEGEIVNLPGLIDTVSVYFLIKEKEKGIFNVSLRSKETINVAEIASFFGGGGHPKAAGFRSYLPFTELIEKLLDKIVEQM